MPPIPKPLRVPKIRLDKLLSNLSICSRSQYKFWIRTNKIALDNIEFKQPPSGKIKVDPRSLRINGKPLAFTPPIHIALHKPIGFTSSHKKEHPDDQTVFDLFPDYFLHLKPELSIAGRLDKRSSGLMILSQDGKLVDRIISPLRRLNQIALPKVYEITTKLPFGGHEQELFASGIIQLDGKKCLPAKFEILSSEQHRARIVLNQGLYHQVRRMIKASKNEVVEIHRTEIGPVKLGDLQEGEFRLLTDFELKMIWKKGPPVKVTPPKDPTKKKLPYWKEKKLREQKAQEELVKKQEEFLLRQQKQKQIRQQSEKKRKVFSELEKDLDQSLIPLDLDSNPFEVDNDENFDVEE